MGVEESRKVCHKRELKFFTKDCPYDAGRNAGNFSNIIVDVRYGRADVP